VLVDSASFTSGTAKGLPAFRTRQTGRDTLGPRIAAGRPLPNWGMHGRRLAAVILGATLAAAPATPRADADGPQPLGQLVDAAAQRLLTADPVAAVKWQTQGNIEDPPRVNQVLAAVTADANAHGVDTGYVRQIFTDQINATEAVEYSRFAQWKLDPASAPTSAPDLSASRSNIDALNRQMVDQIAADWAVLHSPACAAALQDAKNSANVSRRLDALYQQALTFATRSYCA
jgi:chorismate mutase